METLKELDVRVASYHCCERPVNSNMWTLKIRKAMGLT